MRQESAGVTEALLDVHVGNLWNMAFMGRCRGGFQRIVV